jgi:hypothetical protein
MQTSTRRAISHPSLDRSDKPDIPLHIKNVVDAVEKDMSYAQGTFAARPANPGYAGYAYWTTDTHQLYYWDGSAWNTVGVTSAIPSTLGDAKGDLIVFTANDTPARLAVGANNTVLFADSLQATGAKWALETAVDLMAAKGDLLVGTGIDQLAKIVVGSNGQELIADSSQAAGVRWGAPTLTIQENRMAADVTMGTANTFYDGPSLSLVAGSWILVGRIIVTTGAANDTVVSKLWDGTTIVDATQNTRDVNNMVSFGYVTPVSTTTYKISAACNTVNAVIKAQPPYTTAGALGNKAGVLIAIRVG